MTQELQKKGALAKEATFKLAKISTMTKNQALKAMAQALREQSETILKANEIDISKAEENGVRPTMVDRLRLTPERIEAMSVGIEQVAELQDPIGEMIHMWRRPNGLQIGQMRVPLGTIAIIYEARPNVTADAAALCLKTSNAVILRGGKEAICSNMAIVKAMSGAAVAAGMPEGTLQLIEDTSRQTAVELMKCNQFIDVLIPRGGAGLISSVVENATVPVIETGTGNCHTFVDASADLDMALAIAVNAKCSRPSVCNAMESLLVHEAIAGEFLPMLEKQLDGKVELRGCEKTRAIIKANAATEKDWAQEYNDYILAVKVVRDIDEAIDHINRYNTKHSEAIVTNEYTHAQRFVQEVDAAAVYVNASTRFTDGFEFGFGAEIGISTQKMHARGPMGLEALTSMKYVILGDGQIRE